MRITTYLVKPNNLTCLSSSVIIPFSFQSHNDNDNNNNNSDDDDDDDDNDDNNNDDDENFKQKTYILSCRWKL